LLATDPVIEYDRYLRLELPRRIRNQLESTILGASEPLESQLRRQLVDIVRNVQSQISREYQLLNEPHTPTPETQLNQTVVEPSTELSNNVVLTPFDFSAWFSPPTLTDPNMQPPDNETLRTSQTFQSGHSLNFSDSGYGSLNVEPGDELLRSDDLEIGCYSFDLLDKGLDGRTFASDS
jgi:hypothetical protein